MILMPWILALAMQLPLAAARREAEAALRRVPPDSPFVCRVYVPQVDVAPGMAYTFVASVENRSKEAIKLGMPLGMSHPDWGLNAEVARERLSAYIGPPVMFEPAFAEVGPGETLLVRSVVPPRRLSAGRNRITVVLQKRRQVMARSEAFEVVVE